MNTIRGVACFLLVFHHALVDFGNFTGLALKWLYEADNLLTAVRMPLFSFISGFVYALWPADRGRLSEFLSKKVRRILVPFLALTLILLTMKSLHAGGDVVGFIARVTTHLVYGFSHLWFLQAIFIIFVIVGVLDSLVRNKKIGYVAAFLLAPLLYFMPVSQVNMFSIGGAVFLLPFFLLGASIRTMVDHMEGARTPLSLASAIAAASLLAAVYWSSPGAPYARLEILSLLTSVFALFAIFLACPRSILLGKIGSYSFTIYLFHSVFTALGLRVVGAEAGPALFVLVLATAILGPVLVEEALDRRLPALAFVIGKRSRRSPLRQDDGTLAAHTPARLRP